VGRDKIISDTWSADTVKRVTGPVKSRTCPPFV